MTEFWNLVVKSGQRCNVKLERGWVLHLSEASLEPKNEAKDSVRLHIFVEGKKYVIGTLHPERLQCQTFALVLENDFQISHNWEDGSVYFSGFKACRLFDENNITDCSSDDDEDEEETLKKVSREKRTNESASKTPSTNKKAKLASTHQKTEGKKAGAVHVRKLFDCRNFKLESALSSQNQAKHKYEW